MEQTVCFAYFADGKFIGWYADTSGSVRKAPKIYRNSESQLKTITRNFRNKIEKVNAMTFAEAKSNVKNLGDALGLLTYDSGELLSGKDVELRVVECPIYDGPNPKFSRKVHKKFRENHTKLYHAWCKEQGLKSGIKKKAGRAGIGLIDNFKTFEKVYPSPSPKTWIYADYSKVTEWAADEPTEFLGTINS